MGAPERRGLPAGELRDARPFGSVPTHENNPSSVFGGFLQVAFDKLWGYSTNPVMDHNIKTGNYVPAAVLAEVDRKTDDGLPGERKVPARPTRARGRHRSGELQAAAFPPIRRRAPGSSPATTVVPQRYYADNLHSCRRSTSDVTRRAWPIPTRLLPFGPERAGEIVQATVTALGKGYYQVEFVDSAGNVLSVLRLSEEALLSLAGTSCVLAEELGATKRGTCRGQGRLPRFTVGVLNSSQMSRNVSPRRM